MRALTATPRTMAVRASLRGLRGIVGQDAGEAPFRSGCARQLRPGGRQINRVGDAIQRRLVDQPGELQRIVARHLALEGNRSNDDPAVELGQDNIHRKIGRTETALRSHPLRMTAAA